VTNSYKMRLGCGFRYLLQVTFTRQRLTLC